MSNDLRPSPFNPSDWRLALARWDQERAVPVPGQGPEQLGRIPLGWWEEAFSNRPTASEQCGHACGEHQMLTVIAYDITDQRRLRQIAKICEDYGVRVEYSVFECRLEVSSAEVEAESERKQLKLPLKRAKKHPGRQELPAHLPRIEKIIACTPEQCVCGNCGKENSVIGYEKSEQLDVKAAEYFVVLATVVTTP